VLRLLICGLCLFLAASSTVSADAVLPAAVLPAAVLPDEPVLLRYQPPDVPNFSQEIVRTIKQKQRVDSQTVNAESSHEEHLVFDRFSKTDSGDLRLAMRRTKLKARWRIDGAGEYTFDSESSNQEQTSLLGRAYTPMYRTLFAIQSQISLSPSGEMKDVSNAVQTLAGALPEKELADKLIGSDLDSLVRESYGEAWPRLPTEPVAPGAEWSAPVEVTLTGSGEVTGRRIYKLDKFEEVDGNKVARISYRSEIALHVDVTENGIQRSGELTATESTGDIVFDLKASRAISVKSSVRLRGTIKVVVQQTQKTFSIEQDQTSTYSMTEKRS
jgi:hypothetical protein